MKHSLALILLFASPSLATRLSSPSSQTASPLEYPYSSTEVSDNQKQIQQAWQDIELHKIEASSHVQSEKAVSSEIDKQIAETVEWNQDIDHPSHVQGRRYEIADDSFV